MPVPDDDPDRVAGQELPTAGDDSMTWSALYSHLRPPVGLPVPLLPVGEMMRRCPPWVYCTQLASPAVWSPPSMISVWPLPYRSASAGVEKSLSEVNHGNPFRVEPVAAFRAYSSWPTEGATTSVPPCKSPTVSDARTADVAFALRSVTRVFDRSVPASGAVRVERLVAHPYEAWRRHPRPQKRRHRTELPSGATEGVESIGTPPVLAGHPGMACR